MTTEGLIFGVLAPAVVILIGWIAMRLHERELRRGGSR